LASTGSCLWGSFHFDDYSLFSGSLWTPWLIRPLTYLTFWINRTLGGSDPIGYHAVNLALHAASALLLLAALTRLIAPRAALIAVAIFAAHPFAAETVNYVFARSSLLETVLCLACLLDWTKGRFGRATAWFAAALLAKEECVAFPLFLLVMHISLARERRERKWILAMLALAAAEGVHILLATAATPGSGAGLQSGVSWSAYALAQGIVILRYLRLLALPWGFSVDPAVEIPSVALGLGAWIAVVALAALAARRFTRARAGLWFLGGLLLLLPSSSVLPAADLMADRRMYLPMIAFAACAGLLLEKMRPVVLVPGLAALVALSFIRTGTWRTEESLWRDAMEKAPDKVRPKIQLARTLDPKSALELLEQARRTAPEDPVIASEEGRVYLNSGNPQMALGAFGRALALSPRDAAALNNRGAALLALGQRDAARLDFERALAIDPCEFDARLNLLRMGIAQASPGTCRYSPEQETALRRAEAAATPK
jgi:protein O-mannosyl-transferase